MATNQKPTRALKRAYDLERGTVIDSDFLISASSDQYNEIRRAAAVAKELGLPRYVCEKCGHPVYAPKERHTLLPYWHHHSGAPRDCEWWNGNSQSLDKVNSQQFQGQQESPLHKHLKLVIADLLIADSLTTENSVIVDEYLKGTDGRRRPDIRCIYSEKPFAVEIQLSSTQLPIIVGREKFYSENNRFLLWVTWQFEAKPFGQVRTAFQDIYYSHNKCIFSIDDETISKSKLLRKFLVRVFYLKDDIWQNIITNLEDVFWHKNGLLSINPLWHLSFRERWLAVSDKEKADWKRQEELLVELAQQLGLPYAVHYEFADQQIIDLIDFFISIENGFQIASLQSNLAELVVTFMSSQQRYRFSKLVNHILESSGHAQLLDRQSVKNKLNSALSVKQEHRASEGGRIALILFPELFKTHSVA